MTKQITDYVNEILAEDELRKMRDAIANGILLAYQDAIKTGNANMEVSQARGSYTTLAERLIADFNNLNSEKISKGQVEASDLMQSALDIIDKKIAKGQVTMADLTQEVREVLNGDRPLPIVGKDSVIGYENIVDGSITGNKIGDNQVNTRTLAFESVTENRIADKAVSSIKIADNSIGNRHYADDSIEGIHIKDGQVNNRILGNDAVTSGKIADNSIQNRHIQYDQVGRKHLTPSLQLELDGYKSSMGSIGSQRIGVAYPSNTKDLAYTWWISHALRYKGINYIGGIDRTGVQSVVSIDQTNNQTSRVLFRKVEVDDHNQPAIAFLKNRLPIVFYAKHGLENKLFYRIGLDVESIGNFGTEMVLESQGNITYAQVFVHGNKVVVFYRCNILNNGSYWAMRISNDNGLNFGSEILLVKGASVYGKFQQNINNKAEIDVFVYEHPLSGSDQNIYNFKIDLDSLKATKRVNEADVEIGDLNAPTAFPLALSQLRQAFPAPVGTKTRLLDVANDGSRTFAYVSFTNADDAQYFVRKDGETNWQLPVKIANAGKPFEEPAGNHYYFGGVSFLSGDSDVIYASRESNGTWIIEKYVSVDGINYTLENEIERSSTDKLIRPVCYVGGDAENVGFYQKGRFTTYSNYDLDIVQI